MKEYQFRRYTEGVSAVRQDNRAAPVKKGWWAFPAGREHHADNVPQRAGNRRWRSLMVPASALIYVGWNRDGYITRDGFFNSGDWNLMSVEDAMTALKRHDAHILGHSLAPTGPYCGMPLKRLADAASYQVFIPASVRVR